MKNIVVTGSAGLLGSNIYKTLINKEYNVTGIDNLIGGYADNLDGYSYHHIDILDRDAVSFVMKNCDIVIHTAALAYEGLSVFSPKLICENIYAGTASVASAAIENNVKLFINFSSMARYGIGNPPFKETDPTAPVDPYGIAKVHAEELLNLLSDIHGLKVYHVVPHNVVGPGQNYTDPFRNVIAIFANKALRNENIYIYGDGKQKRSISHVDDCVKAIIKLIELNRFPTKEIFNIGPDGNESTINELAKLVIDCVWEKFDAIYVEIKHLPDRPREVKNAFVSVEKAKKELNYNAIANNKEIIMDIINFIEVRGTMPFEYKLPIEIIKENTPKTWTEKLI